MNSALIARVLRKAGLKASADRAAIRSHKNSPVWEGASTVADGFINVGHPITWPEYHQAGRSWEEYCEYVTLQCIPVVEVLVKAGFSPYTPIDWHRSIDGRPFNSKPLAGFYAN